MGPSELRLGPARDDSGHSLLDPARGGTAARENGGRPRTASIFLQIPVSKSPWSPVSPRRESTGRWLIRSEWMMPAGY